MKNNFIIVEPVFEGMEYKFIWMTGGKEVIITQGYDIIVEQAHVGSKILDKTVARFTMDMSSMDIANMDDGAEPRQLLIAVPSFVKDKDEIKIALEYQNKEGHTVTIEGLYNNDVKKPSVALLGIQGVSVDMTQQEVADAFGKYIAQLQKEDELV